MRSAICAFCAQYAQTPSSEFMLYGIVTLKNSVLLCSSALAQDTVLLTERQDFFYYSIEFKRSKANSLQKFDKVATKVALKIKKLHYEICGRSYST